jgi:hypothetical protein
MSDPTPETDSHRSITEDQMVHALERTLVAHGRIPPEEARPTARMILSYFGPDESVLDNALASEDRDRFYWLEDEGLITSQEEDATVAQGRSWRIHYWILQKARIRELLSPPVPGRATSAAEAVYQSIGERDWRRPTEDPAP